MGVLVDDVYTHRMSGEPLTATQKDVLTSWVQSIPAPRGAPSWVESERGLAGSRSFFRERPAAPRATRATSSQTIRR